jgi:hypothetical protein
MMSNEPTGRPERTTANTSPMGSAVAIAIAIGAVILGFLVLRSIRNDTPDAGSGSSASSSTVASADSSTTLTQPTQTTAFVDTLVGTEVQVSNNAGVAKAAGGMSTILEVEGFSLADPTNGSTTTETVTKILFDSSIPAAQNVAFTVARKIGVSTVTPIDAGAAVPTVDGTLPTGVGVLVVLGTDKAGKTLAEMTGTGAVNTTTSNPPTPDT